MNSWAGRATYFPHTSSGGSGAGSGSGSGSGGVGGVGASFHGGVGERGGFYEQTVRVGEAEAETTAKLAHSAQRKQPQSLPRKGSRGLLSEEIAEQQKAHMEQGNSGSPNLGLNRPPLSPAAVLMEKHGFQCGALAGGGGGAGLGGLTMNRSMSEEPLFNDHHGGVGES